MKEVIAELLNEGNVILYNKDMLDDVMKELDDKNIQYNIKDYEEYVYITKVKGKDKKQHHIKTNKELRQLYLSKRGKSKTEMEHGELFTDTVGEEI